MHEMFSSCGRLQVTLATFLLPCCTFTKLISFTTCHVCLIKSSLRNYQCSIGGVVAGNMCLMLQALVDIHVKLCWSAQKCKSQQVCKQRAGQSEPGWGWGRQQINYESENNVITWNPIDEHGAQWHKKALKTRAARKCNWHFYNVLVTKERQPCRCCWPRTAGKVRLRNMTNICYNRLIVAVVAVASAAVSCSLFGSCVTRLRTRECRWASGNCWMALNGLLCQRMQSSSVRTQVLPVQIVADKYRSGLARRTTPTWDLPEGVEEKKTEHGKGKMEKRKAAQQLRLFRISCELWQKI